MAQGVKSKNMRLIGQSALGGFGNGGEGFSLKQLSDGKRVLFVAHEGPPKDFTVVDVTDPSRPRVITQIDLPHENIRSNSLALVGDILLVAYQAGLDPDPSNFNVDHAGMGVWDVSHVERPREIAFFNTAGDHSRGAHYVWFVDGRYAQLSTGMPDSRPTHPYDDQFYDIRDPFRPEEVAYYVPEAPEGTASIMINDLYVDEHGLIYALDRVKGGLYVIEMDF